MRGKSAELADAVIASEVDTSAELAKISLGVNPDDMAILKKPMREVNAATTFDASKDTKTIELVEGDSTHTVTIGADLSAA